MGRKKHDWYQDSGNNPVDNTRKNPPCPFVTTDPTGGQVLDIPWRNTYVLENGYPWNTNQIYTASPDGAVNPTAQFPATIPPNYVIEYTLRFQSTPNATSAPFLFTGSQVSVWEFFDGNPLNGYESDTDEDFQVFGGNPSSTIHDWGGSDADNGYTSVASPPHDPRQYHTWSTRRTSDGTGNTAFCSYLDGNLNTAGGGSTPGCAVMTHPGGGDLTKRVKAIIWAGMVCGGDYSDHSCWPGGAFALDTYVKSVRVWSCSAWQTTLCNRSVFTGTPWFGIPAIRNINEGQGMV